MMAPAQNQLRPSLANLDEMSAQREQFARDGFAVFDQVLAGPHLELLRGECAQFVARDDRRMDEAGFDHLGLNHRNRRYFANECQREQPALRRMLFSEEMAAICCLLLGPDVYFFFDQFVVKGPENGMAFSWHQDSGYVAYNGGPPDHAPYLTCWCPLDDVSIENGTISVIPFSKHPQSRDMIMPHDRNAQTNDLIAQFQPVPAVTIDVKAGSVVAFSSRILHASGANRSDAFRRVYLAQYTTEVMLNPGTKHLRRNAVPLVRDGRKVMAA